jgi:hypothetical protein
MVALGGTAGKGQAAQWGDELMWEDAGHPM